MPLLAHHRRDQAETCCCSPCAAPAGRPGRHALAQWRDGVCWARPWLQQSRQTIEAYARAWLAMDRGSQQRRRALRRNALRQHWPAFRGRRRGGLVQSAQWAQRRCNWRLKSQPGRSATVATADALDLTAWAHLPARRASNALRAWLSQASGGRCPPHWCSERLLTEAKPTPRCASWPAPLRVAGGLPGHAALGA